jgi:pilus assembly protein CpaE
MAPRQANPLTALMIAPDRDLAARFAATLGRSHAFEVLAEVKSYPARQVLEMRLRQVKPQVVLLDAASDLERASEIIGLVAAHGVALACLHKTNDPDAILRCLRLGAAEFLYEPFDPEIQEQARARIARLPGREPASQPGGGVPGKVLAFTSAKPGSGASTLATQTALALRGDSGVRVLAIDLDLADATVSFYLKLRPGRSLMDLLAGDGALEDWPELVEQAGGLDVLPAPDFPAGESVEPPRLAEFLERARQLYDWTLVDLPPAFHRLTLLAASQADTVFLVATPELPSLHLARKAAGLLTELGFGADRYRLLLNRVDSKWDIGAADVARIVSTPVAAHFPNDYFALERAFRAGEPVASSTTLARAVAGFARSLAGAARPARKK